MDPTHKPILDYFQSLNEKLVDFPEKSYFRMDLEEIMGSFRSRINFPAMAVESPDGDAEGSTVSNSVLGRLFAFTIYQNPEKGNFAEQNQMIDQCERIGLKIIARMRYDAFDPEHLLYNHFLVSSVKWTKVGPIFNEELFGYRFTGIISGSESLKVDPADWSDVDSVC